MMESKIEAARIGKFIEYITQNQYMDMKNPDGSDISKGFTFDLEFVQKYLNDIPLDKISYELNRLVDERILDKDYELYFINCNYEHYLDMLKMLNKNY